MLPLCGPLSYLCNHARRTTLARVAIFAIRATLSVQVAWTNLDHMWTPHADQISSWQRSKEKKDIVSQIRQSLRKDSALTV